MSKGKGLIRAGSRKGTKTKKATPAESRAGRLPEPTVCERCGAAFSRRVWRRGHRVNLAFFDRAAWTVCPACKQEDNEEYLGRVVIRGQYASDHDAAIRKRIANVDRRAQFTQPQRRVVSAAGSHGELEVLTTSQKLAHRIVHELKKTFQGRASYKWSDDGSLFAVWERD
jgi:hypothetical protein